MEAVEPQLAAVQYLNESLATLEFDAADVVDEQSGVVAVVARAWRAAGQRVRARRREPRDPAAGDGPRGPRRTPSEVSHVPDHVVAPGT